MRRLNDLTHEQIIEYNLRDGGTAVSIFLDTQHARVMKARDLVSKCIAELGPGRVSIYEPGCGAGDISGAFSDRCNVTGFDVVPAAVEKARNRYPDMNVFQARIEDVKPVVCDVLVLCEFMEHVADPMYIAMSWMPLAKRVVIGHPIIGDGTDPEYGHVWAYDERDFDRWFEIGGHEMAEAYTFEMGYHMIIGRGRRIE